METVIACLAVLLVLMALTEHHMVKSCQCSPPRHPQERFCNAQYVIIGRIVERMEEFDNDFPQIPFNMYIPGDDLVALPTTTEPTPESVPVGRIPILRKVQPPPSELEVFPPMMVNDGYWEKRGKLKYVVQVEKVFKGKERILKNSKVVIQTDLSSSYCGMTNLNLEERYLISGSFDGDQLSIYLCDWVERTADLTKTQRRGLRHFYSKYCDTCQIETGSFYFPQETGGKRVCSYNANSRASVDCEAKYSSCMLRPNGTCGWYKGKDFKMCRKGTNAKQSRRE